MTTTTRGGTLALLLALVTLLAGGCAVAAPITPPEPPPPPRASLTYADVSTWLDGLVPAGLEHAGIAGAAVTVMRDGQVLAARGYGVSGPDGRPVDADRTPFRVGSVAKVATATAVLQQVEKGRIDLDADVSRYLDFPLPRRYQDPITMRNLLTHTAGFEERVRGLIGLDGAPTRPLRDVVATDPPEQVFAPGTTPAYSNYGYGLAGYVVERVSGEPFERYLAEHVLAPAGMASSSAAQPLPADLAPRMSGGWTSIDAPPQPFETVNPAPAGALTGTATDMARLGSSLLGAGAPLLSPATSGLMQRPALDARSLGGLAEGPRMGLGLFDESRDGVRMLEHGGDTQFFHAQLRLFPDQRTVVFVVLNSSGRGATDTHDLRHAVVDGFADRYLPVEHPAAPTTTDPGTAGRASAMAGRYESARAPFSTFLAIVNLVGQTTVTAQPDGTLRVTPGLDGSGAQVYREVRPGLWHQVGGALVLSTRSDDGRVTAIGFDGAFTLLRAGAARDAAITLPVVVVSLALLVLGLLAVPAAATARRHFGVGAAPSPGRVDRIAGGVTRVAAAAAVVALAGWTGVVTALTGLAAVPDPVLVGLQVLQWIALSGVPAGAVAVVTGLRGGIGRLRMSGRLLLFLGLVGTAWIAIAFSLLVHDLGY